MKFIFLIDDFKHETMINLNDIKEIFLSPDTKRIRIEYNGATLRCYCKEIERISLKEFLVNEDKYISLNVSSLNYEPKEKNY